MMDQRLDLLLAGTADHEREIRAAGLRAHADVRVKEVSDGREAVTSLSRGAYHALVCAQDLADLSASALTRMIRAGACGPSGLPVVVVSPEPELQSLSKTDSSTHFLAASTPDVFAHQVLDLIRAVPKPTLLLVEDDPTHAEATALMLTRYYSVEQARSGPAALSAWRANRHAVVLLDLMLPGMSGEEVQRWILKEAPDQIIIVLTANSEADKHPAMVLAGASAFLRKPVDVVAVTYTIESILRDREYRHLTGAVRGSSERLHLLTARMHAANYSLSRGKAAIAARHLQSALTNSVVRGPTDDEWAKLLSEYDTPPYI